MESLHGIVRENTWSDCDRVFGRTLRSGDLISLETALENTGDVIARQLGLQKNPFALQRRNRQLRVAGLAGTLRLDRVRLEIVPKFWRSDVADPTWHATLLAMLARNGGSRLSFSRLGVSESTGSPFVDHVALAYAEALSIAGRQEIIHSYVVREERSPFLRGRLAFERQVSGLLARPHLIESDIDLLDVDNHYNQLLVWASDALAARVVSLAIREELQEASSPFAVGLKSRALPTVIPTRLPPQYAHYAEAFEIARSLALGLDRSHGSGVVAGYGLILGMDKVFEKFVETSLHVALRPWKSERQIRVQAQATELYARAVSDKTRSYYSRPDNVITRETTPVLLVDAKYKTLSEADGGTPKRPSNSDVYQMAAALVAHGCDRGLLVYPKVETDRRFDDGKMLAWRVPNPTLHIMAGALDLHSVRSLPDLATCDQALRGLVDACLQ